MIYVVAGVVSRRLQRGCRYRKVNKWCQCRKLRVTARSQVREFSDLGVIAMPGDDSGVGMQQGTVFDKLRGTITIKPANS